MEENECSFSLELKSRDKLKSINLNGDRKQGLLVQGSLGTISKIKFQEDSVFVISASKGEIRLDLTLVELQSMLNREENKDE
jgi:hypothetical protein